MANSKKSGRNNKKNRKQNLDRKQILIVVAAVAAGILALFLVISTATLGLRAVGAWQCGAEEPFYSVKYGREIIREILLEESGEYVEAVLDPETEDVLDLKTGTWKTGFFSVILQEEGSESGETYRLNPFTGNLSNDGATYTKD